MLSADKCPIGDKNYLNVLSTTDPGQPNIRGPATSSNTSNNKHLICSTIKCCVSCLAIVPWNVRAQMNIFS